MDTFPKVMSLCFPGVKYSMNKSDWFMHFPNKSEIWLGGLDDKERTEKMLGKEGVMVAAPVPDPRNRDCGTDRCEYWST